MLDSSHVATEGSFWTLFKVTPLCALHNCDACCTCSESCKPRQLARMWSGIGANGLPFSCPYLQQLNNTPAQLWQLFFARLIEWRIAVLSLPHKSAAYVFRGCKVAWNGQSMYVEQKLLIEPMNIHPIKLRQEVDRVALSVIIAQLLAKAWCKGRLSQVEKNCGQSIDAH